MSVVNFDLPLHDSLSPFLSPWWFGENWGLHYYSGTLGAEDREEQFRD